MISAKITFYYFIVFLCNATLSVRFIIHENCRQFKSMLPFSLSLFLWKKLSVCVQDQFSNISRKDKFSSFVLKRDFLAFAFDLRSDLFVPDQFFRSFRSLQADRSFIASIFYVHGFVWWKCVCACDNTEWFIQSPNCSGWRWTSHACTSLIWFGARCVCRKTYNEIIGKN